MWISWPSSCAFKCHMQSSEAWTEAEGLVSKVPHLTGKLLLAGLNRSQFSAQIFPKTLFRASNPRGKDKSRKWFSWPGTRSHVPLLLQFLLENLPWVCSKDEKTVPERRHQEAKITWVHLGGLPTTASHSLRETVHNTWIRPRIGIWNTQIMTKAIWKGQKTGTST